MNTESFIEKSKEIHGDKYDYSLVNYIKSKTKVEIICHHHGIFKQKPNHHLNGQGCPICGRIKNSNSTKLTYSSLINSFNNIHNNRYDYSLVNYVNYNTKIKIKCNVHGIFEQTPKNHILNKCGCPKCAVTYKSNKLKLSQSEFINKSNLIHNNKYDYSLVEYVNNKVLVNIICSKHGIFKQAPLHHMRGIGCPFCNSSKGELMIKTILENKKILFIKNKTFDDCIDISRLKFDFYLPLLNTVIEFDGIQHFKPIQAFGGVIEFLNIQRRDNIKNEYCQKNNIRLLRIKYNENIENKLIKFLDMNDK